MTAIGDVKESVRRASGTRSGAASDLQRATAEAYAKVFAPTAEVALILDDITTFTNALPESQQGGAMRLLAYVLSKRTHLRRAQRRDKETKA